MSNALAALGILRTQTECEKLCKTDATKGTPTKQLMNGIAAVEGLTPILLKEARRDVALLRVDKALGLGRPVILCVDSGSHWVAAVGRLGDRYLVADSADNELVLSRDVEALEARWRDKGTKHPYLGVIV